MAIKKKFFIMKEKEKNNVIEMNPVAPTVANGVLPTEDVSDLNLSTKDWNKKVQDGKRIRAMNEENLKDLRMQAEYEKLMWEINHYRLQQMVDFVNRSKTMDSYYAAKEKFENLALTKNNLVN